MTENSVQPAITLASGNDTTSLLEQNAVVEPIGNHSTQPISPRIFRFALVATWCLLLYGLTALHTLDLGHFGGLCGRWGCLPATSSLLGMHLIWLLVLSTATFAIVKWKPGWCGWLICGAFGFALLATLGISITAVVRWSPTIAEYPQLLPFSFVNQTDIPVTQSIIIGAALTVFRRIKNAAQSNVME